MKRLDWNIPVLRCRVIRLLCVLLTMSALVDAQDAVNPCTVDTESFGCASPGHEAEIAFRTIKLNGKRRTNQDVAGGQDLEISTAVKYTKRAKGILTTNFLGGCPQRTEEKRYKPPVDVTYTASLINGGGPTHNYSGSGDSFTIPAVDLSSPAAVLNVTFSIAGSPNCVATPLPVGTKTFNLSVDDSLFSGTITAIIDSDDDDTVYTKRTITVPDGSYFLWNRDKRLEMTVDFTSQLGSQPSNSSIVWSCVRVDAAGNPIAGTVPGTFNSGGTGSTIKWRQDETYVSQNLNDVLIKATTTGAEATFNLTIFRVDDMHVTLGLNDTRQFIVPDAKIHPQTADLSIIEGILGEPETMDGIDDGVRLKTRTYTDNSDYEDLGDESTVSGIFQRATYKVVSGKLYLEVQSNSTAGKYNITWESKRFLHATRFLHRVHAEVVTSNVPPVLTLTLGGTNDTGPHHVGVETPFVLDDQTSAGTFGTNLPVWHVEAPTGSSVTPPDAGDHSPSFTFNNPGKYTVKIEDSGAEASFEVFVYGCDLDIDSDNTNIFGSMDRSPEEDAIEDIQGDINKPGKVIQVVTGDRDYDFIPDYADGWNRTAANDDDNKSPNDHLVEITLELPEPIDVTIADVELAFSANALNTGVTPPNYARADTNPLRIWKTKDNRTQADYIAPGVHSATSLGFTSSKRSVDLFVEGINGSDDAGDERILMKVDPDGSGPLGFLTEDAVRMTMLEIIMISSAEVRAFHPDDLVNDYTEDITISVKPTMAITGGHVTWRNSSYIKGSSWVERWDNRVGEVEFRKDPTDSWTTGVTADDDLAVQIRIKKPGRGGLRVIYGFSVDSHPVYNQTVFDLSVPQIYTVDFSQTQHGADFDDDLVGVGLRNEDIGPNPDQITATRNQIVRTTLEADIIDEIRSRYPQINAVFLPVANKPTFLDQSMVTTIVISGVDPPGDSVFGFQRGNGGGNGAVDLAANTLDIGNNNPDDECYVFSGEHSWDFWKPLFPVSVDPFDIKNSDWDDSDPWNRTKMADAREYFKILVGGTAAHEAGHALGLVPVSTSVLHNTTNYGDLMDDGAVQDWYDRIFQPTFNSVNMTRVRKVLPTHHQDDFR